MRNNRVSLLITLMTSLFFASACGQVVVDWIDFVKLEDRTYEAAWKVVVADPSNVVEQVGTVKKMLDGNVTRANYKSKNGDAAYLPKGTKLMKLDGIATDRLLAVADASYPNGYKLYSNRSNPEAAQLIQTASESGKVVRVDLIEDGGQTMKFHRTLNGDAASSFAAMLKSADSSVKPASGPDGSDTKYYSVVVYTADNPLAVRYRIRYAGTHYWLESESGEYGKLPAEIEREFK